MNESIAARMMRQRELNKRKRQPPEANYPLERDPNTIRVHPNAISVAPNDYHNSSSSNLVQDRKTPPIPTAEINSTYGTSTANTSTNTSTSTSTDTSTNTNTNTNTTNRTNFTNSITSVNSINAWPEDASAHYEVAKLQHDNRVLQKKCEDTLQRQKNAESKLRQVNHTHRQELRGLQNALAAAQEASRRPAQDPSDETKMTQIKLLTDQNTEMLKEIEKLRQERDDAVLREEEHARLQEAEVRGVTAAKEILSGCASEDSPSDKSSPSNGHLQSMMELRCELQDSKDKAMRLKASMEDLQDELSNINNSETLTQDIVSALETKVSSLEHDLENRGWMIESLEGRLSRSNTELQRTMERNQDLEQALATQQHTMRQGGSKDGCDGTPSNDVGELAFLRSSVQKNEDYIQKLFSDMLRVESIANELHFAVVAAKCAGKPFKEDVNLSDVDDPQAPPAMVLLAQSQIEDIEVMCDRLLGALDVEA